MASERREPFENGHEQENEGEGESNEEDSSVV